MKTIEEFAFEEFDRGFTPPLSDAVADAIRTYLTAFLLEAERRFFTEDEDSYSVVVEQLEKEVLGDTE